MDGLVLRRGLLRMSKTLRNLPALLGALLIAVAPGCLPTEQDDCTPLETLCLEGAVWTCRGDGSGWEREAICPAAKCENGQCVLPPLPSDEALPETPDVVPATADGGAETSS